MDEKDKKINFDFNSKKFFILLGLVCILFIVLVINAFIYVPKDDDLLKREENNTREETVNKNIYEQNSGEEQIQKQENSEEAVKTEENKTKKGLNIVFPKPKDEIDFVEIEAPAGTNPEISESKDSEEAQTVKPAELTPEEKAEALIKSASKLRAEKQFVKALDEYQKVPTLTADKNLVAESYEGISTIYAINRRYGTALTYAIKAYNTYPTSMREIMLARLYYKTGDIQKATQRVNNVLRREFADDRW